MANTSASFVWMGLLLVLSGSPAAIASDSVPEVTHDGLHLLKNTKLARVWMKPGASLAGYNKLQILDCYVAFKKNWQRERDFSRQIPAERMDAIKKELAEEFRKVFIEELGKGGYQVVDKPAHDVLLVRPAVINLVIEAPEPPAASGITTYAASSGQMTLVAELYDSATSDLLLRAIDAEAGEGSGMIEWQNSGTNLSEARHILRQWADRLRKALDEAHGR
jgi:hypothetical protein